MFEAVGACDVSPLWSYYVVQKEYLNLFYWAQNLQMILGRILRWNGLPSEWCFDLAPALLMSKWWNHTVSTLAI